MTTVNVVAVVMTTVNVVAVIMTPVHVVTVVMTTVNVVAVVIAPLFSEIVVSNHTFIPSVKSKAGCKVGHL